MKKSPFQFSLAALLLTVAAVAGVLALMLRVPPGAAFLSFAGIIPILTALALTGLGGRPGLRAFCIGALVPLGLTLYSEAQNLNWMAFRFARLVSPANGMGLGCGLGGAGIVDEGAFSKLFGVAILMNTASGYLCVGFRWLIERRERPEG